MFSLCLNQTMSVFAFARAPRTSAAMDQTSVDSLVAGIFSPEFSVVSGGLICIIAILAIAALVPDIQPVKVE